MRKIFLESGFQVLTGDSSTYYKREDGKLTGMIMTHVDDFNVESVETQLRRFWMLFKRSLVRQRKSNTEERLKVSGNFLKRGRLKKLWNRLMTFGMRRGRF